MESFYITKLSTYIPSARLTTDEAVNLGLYNKERAFTDGFSAVAIEHQRPVMEMALSVAREAAEGLAHDELQALIFTSIHRHGHKRLWLPASYLHRGLGLASHTLTFGFNHGCNGAFLAIDFAARTLIHQQDKSIIVVGADRFQDSLFDRWQSDLGTIYGDAASAVRISTYPGLFHVVFLSSESETRLEEMYRDQAPLPENIQNLSEEHAVGISKRRYFEVFGRPHFEKLFVDMFSRLRNRLIHTTALKKRRAKYVLYPNVGAGISAKLYSSVFGDLADNHGWDFGRSIGHTGVSDQFIGLKNLTDNASLNKGDLILLIGAGNGLSGPVMLLEFTGSRN